MGRRLGGARITFAKGPQRSGSLLPRAKPTEGAVLCKAGGEPPAPRTMEEKACREARHVYIDAGVNWCNTLELWRKVLEAQPFVDERWQIYGFEASPLIMPFAERAVPRRSRPAGPCRRRPCGLL